MWECLKELKTNTSNEQDIDRATLQSNNVVAQFRTTNEHASRNVLKRCQSMVEGTSSPSSQSFQNFIHNPSPMFDETHELLSRLAIAPPVTTFECTMTKSKMLQSQ